jgi:hypothetical protein
MKFNKNRFLKWFFSLFSIFYFIFSLKIAKAEGVATIFTWIIVAVVVVLAVVVQVAPALIPFLLVAEGTPILAAPLAYGVGAALTAGLIGIGVGEIQCLVGQNNIFFTGCEETPGAWGGQQVTAGSPTLINEDYTATCTSVSLTYDISGANQYGIYRDGSLINQGNASGLSKITYTDSGLTPHTSYRYVLVMTDNNGVQSQYPEINAYTKCGPQCTFGADKTSVVYPAKVTLSWDCQYADSCSISPEVGSVSASGQTEVQPTDTTSYILTCQNADGSTSFSSSINVTNPKVKEIKP